MLFPAISHVRGQTAPVLIVCVATVKLDALKIESVRGLEHPKYVHKSKVFTSSKGRELEALELIYTIILLHALFPVTPL